MNSRREFFSRFIGQVGALRDDIRGVQNIPLNRLNELPENIIEQIKPVFFQDEKWHLKDKLLCIPGIRSTKEINIELNQIEFEAFVHFEKGTSLKQIAIEIAANSDLPYDEIYQIITSLFFKLAAIRICHPFEIYQFEEIIKSTNKR
jgi:hypothetical protein